MTEFWQKPARASKEAHALLELEQIPLDLAQDFLIALSPPPCGEGLGVGRNSRKTPAAYPTRRYAPASPQGGGGAIANGDPNRPKTALGMARRAVTGAPSQEGETSLAPTLSP